MANRRAGAHRGNASPHLRFERRHTSRRFRAHRRTIPQPRAKPPSPRPQRPAHIAALYLAISGQRAPAHKRRDFTPHRQAPPLPARRGWGAIAIADNRGILLSGGTTRRPAHPRQPRQNRRFYAGLVPCLVSCNRNHASDQGRMSVIMRSGNGGG